MKRFHLPVMVVLVILCSAAPRPAQAQIIRGTVEDSTGLPINDVRVVLLPATSDSILREARSGNAGEFSFSMTRAGKFRIRLNRVGFAQQTSSVIEVLPAQIVTLRFTLHVVPRQLNEVTVLERRNVTLTELMSASGFDMRNAKYPMRSMNSDQLANESFLDVEDVFSSRRLMGVELVNDAVGAYLQMTTQGGGGNCLPEVYLDGMLLSDTGQVQASMAMNLIGGMSKQMLYGIEVYRGEDIPPPSLGGLFGTVSYASGRLVAKKCGAVAVWTKVGRERSLVAERAKGGGTIQVIRGSVVDFDSGEPAANVQITLRSEFGADVGNVVVSDSTGTFIIHTNQFEKLRLYAWGGGFIDLLTPAFWVNADDMLTVRVILSKRHKPLAPIALVAREHARNYLLTDRRGFSFRQRRALEGTYFDAAAIVRSGANSVSDLLRGLANVVVSDGVDSLGISLRTLPVRPARGGGNVPAPGPGTCRPMYFLNGELRRDAETSIRTIPASQLFGVEVFPLETDVPSVYRMGSTGCGVIGVWTK